MTEAMTSMPKIQSETLRIEGVLEDMDNEMKMLALQLNAFDEKNVVGIEDLSRLDTLKSNMENCRAMLEEHTRWSQLVREARMFIESNDRFADSADRIEVMVRSLEILRHMPGHQDRQDTCKSLTENLLGNVRPALKDSICGTDFASLREYLYVYTKLGR